MLSALRPQHCLLTLHLKQNFYNICVFDLFNNPTQKGRKYALFPGTNQALVDEFGDSPLSTDLLNVSSRDPGSLTRLP